MHIEPERSLLALAAMRPVPVRAARFRSHYTRRVIAGLPEHLLRDIGYSRNA